MKKVLCTIISIMLSVSVVGCASGNTSTTQTSSTPTSTPTATATPTAAVKQPEQAAAPFEIDTYVKALEAKGKKVTKVGLMSFTVLGAIDGYKYQVDGLPVEVYKFDLNSKDPHAVDNIKLAKTSNKINLYLQGSTMECTGYINNNLVILISADSAAYDDIKQVFKDLK